MRKQPRHNWIICCIAVILAGLLAACQGNEPTQESTQGTSVPTISILTIGSCSQQALARVSEAVSAITMERLGCMVELQTTSEKDYDARIDNLLLERDLADIVICRNRDTLMELLDGNYIYRLDRFLRNYPALLEAVPDESRWEETSVGTYCYAIPFGNSQSYRWGFLMRQDICDALGIDPENIRNLEDLHQVLLQVKAAYPNMIPVVPNYGNMETFVDYAPLSNDIGVLAQDGTVCGIESLPEFAEICATMHQWYQEGLILENAPFDYQSRTDWICSGIAFGSFARVGQYTRQELSYAYGDTICCVPLGELQTNSGMEDGCFCIYAYTPDVDLCLRLLELLYTDPALLTMCIYGEEGVDYTLAEDGAAVPVPGEDAADRYFSWNWPLRDTVPQPFSTGKKLVPPASPTAGFVFDGASLVSEFYQCNAVMEKYYNALCSGMIDPEIGLEFMKAELESAHLEVILAQKQRQWTEWLASVS